MDLCSSSSQNFILLVKFIGAFFFLALCLIFFLSDLSVLSRGKDQGSFAFMAQQSPPPSVPLILSWTGFFGLDMTEWLLGDNDNVAKCPYICKYTNDRQRERDAAVIIFHIRDGFGQLPEYRTSKQLYTFFLLESPQLTYGGHRRVPPDFFNITMTYRTDSDIFYPYEFFDKIQEGKKEETWTEEEVEMKVARKSKLALQFVSHCQADSGRDKMVEELGKHMEVTQMGKCSGRTGCGKECFDQMMDDHFFYLAFENAVCRNYVTEKFWNLKKLIVPVVLTRTVFENLLDNVPNGTFIAVDDFANVGELANHLKWLTQNKEHYMKYFEWTKQYKKTPHGKEPMNPLCQLCKLAYEKPTTRMIRNIVDFWDGGGQCKSHFSEHFLGMNG